MTPEENVKYFESLQMEAADSANEIADAMGATFSDRVKNVTLKKTFVPPGLFHQATMGMPPAYQTGNLARLIVRTPALAGGLVATSSVGAYAEYSAIQEFGGPVWGNRGLMHWRNSAGSWFMKSAYIPEHPYMRPTLERVIRDGTLQASAIHAFVDHMALFLGFRG